MQIARVVPKVRTQNEDYFDYAISPGLLPQIKPCILVEIPFRGRKIEGIVYDLKRKPSTDLKVPLKSIIRVLDPTPVLDNHRLLLAKWMADYYLAPLSKTIFENVVPPALNILKKEPGYVINLTISARGQKYLVIADFPKRLSFYLASIKKTVAQNRSVIILVPDLSLIKYFPIQNLGPVSVLHSALQKTVRWQEFDKIRAGKSKIIIGSLSALFAPTPNLGLIIIDQEENESYKSERSPRFHAVEAAEKLAEISRANLILGTLVPRVETYFKALKNIYQIKKDPRPQKTNVTVVSQDGRFEPLSPTLQNKIEENFKKKKKIILVLNRKGEGTKFSCADCGWISNCPHCLVPLSARDDSAICGRCNYKSSLPEKCPACQSVNIRSFGLGTAKLEKFVHDFWPNIKTIRLESQPKTDKQSFNQNWDLAIATNYALKLSLPPIGLAAIIDADTALNFPDFRAGERGFQTFYKFLRIAEQGIIQTKIPENPLIAALGRLNFEKFFLSELAIRQKYQFPPFRRLVRLVNKNPRENLARQSANELSRKLLELISAQKLPVLLYGPSPAPKKREVFREQIILKVIGNFNQKKFIDFKRILKNLDRDWTLDVDPIGMD